MYLNITTVLLSIALGLFLSVSGNARSEARRADLDAVEGNKTF